MFKITVKLADKRKVEIEVDTIIGNYAVHKALWNAKPQGPEWSVTHTILGIRLWSVREYSEALKVARWLDEQGPIPRDEPGTQLWHKKLDPTAYTRFVEQLSEIAPRYI